MHCHDSPVAVLFGPVESGVFGWLLQPLRSKICGRRLSILLEAGLIRGMERETDATFRPAFNQCYFCETSFVWARMVCVALHEAAPIVGRLLGKRLSVSQEHGRHVGPPLRTEHRQHEVTPARIPSVLGGTS